MIATRDLDHFREEGYCIVSPTLPPLLLDALRRAANSVVERTRAGVWPHRRNWPYKVFKGKNDFWGVSHLLHPDLGEPDFARYLALPDVLGAAKALLGLSAEEAAARLRIEFMNLLINPVLEDFEIGWHRDVVREDLAPEEEVAELAQPHGAVRWNFALFEDACLLVIPGSHRRAKTAGERQAVLSRNCSSLPGEVRIHLEAGQAVYYNTDLLHRGIYPKSCLRRTLHCDMGLGTDLRHQDALYQSLAWMAREDVRSTLPEVLHAYHENFLRGLGQARGLAR